MQTHIGDIPDSFMTSASVSTVPNNKKITRHDDDVAAAAVAPYFECLASNHSAHYTMVLYYYFE